MHQKTSGGRSDQFGRPLRERTQEEIDQIKKWNRTYRPGQYDDIEYGSGNLINGKFGYGKRGGAINIYKDDGELKEDWEELQRRNIAAMKNMHPKKPSSRRRLHDWEHPENNNPYRNWNQDPYGRPLVHDPKDNEKAERETKLYWEWEKQFEERQANDEQERKRQRIEEYNKMYDEVGNLRNPGTPCSFIYF